MKRKWILFAAIIVTLPLFGAAVMYYGALDWGRSHRHHVEALPFLNENAGADTGEFQLTANDMTFRVRVAGLQNEGPNVILLHGFPESSKIWEELLPIAAKEGFRLLAFDQRGYSPGARPAGSENYKVSLLVNDLFEVATAAGFEKFHLAGHDWGAVVGWFAAMQRPDRLLSWSALSIPHAGAFFKGAVHDPVQSQRSGYIKFFQKPFTPEFMMSIRDQKAFRDMFARIPYEHREEYIRIQAEPGALTASLNWYRAIDIEEVAEGPEFLMPVSVPTLFIWGTEDLVISEGVVENARSLMPDDYTEVALKAGHALMQHAGDQVIPQLINHWQDH